MTEVGCKFEESVRSIEGLMDYRPRRIPPWFRERLLECCLTAIPHDIGDEALVDDRVGKVGVSWLGPWGQAEINGASVFLFESDGLLEPIAFAADLECGLHLVENDDCCCGFTIFFTEHPVRRRQAAGATRNERTPAEGISAEVTQEKLASVVAAGPEVRDQW